jgi:hypothetical protein
VQGLHGLQFFGSLGCQLREQFLVLHDVSLWRRGD